MEKKINIIALFGKAGAGKDTIQRLLIQHFENAQSIISNTTRPKRDYEKDGIDYHFLSVEDFAKKVLNGETNILSNDYLYFSVGGHASHSSMVRVGAHQFCKTY